MTKTSKKKNIDFLLHSKLYQKIHLGIYIISVLIIVCVYFATLLLFPTFVHFILTAMISFLIGLYVVFHRDELVKEISEKIYTRKRIKYKIASRNNLQSTLKRIVPERKSKLKLRIKKKTTVHDMVKTIKTKIKTKNKNKTNTESTKKRPDSEYIEIK